MSDSSNWAEIAARNIAGLADPAFDLHQVFATSSESSIGFADSLKQFDAQRKEAIETIASFKVHIREVEAMIESREQSLQRYFMEFCSMFSAFRGTWTTREIRAVWWELVKSVPEFRDKDKRGNSLERVFLRCFDLDDFLIMGAFGERYDWEDLDDAINGAENGQKALGIIGGLEMYQGTFPFEDDLFLPPDGHGCIYFLRDRNMNVLYVGQSKYIRNRLATHWKQQIKRGLKIFDVVRLRSNDLLNQEEHRMIMKFNPPYNKNLKRDNERLINGEWRTRFPEGVQR